MKPLIILGKSRQILDLMEDFPNFFDKYDSVVSVNTDETDYINLNKNTADFIACIGSTRSYLTKIDTLRKLKILNWTKICRKKYNNRVDYGSIVYRSTYISPSAIIGKHCLIMGNCSINHDTYIGSGVNIAPNTTICGHVTINNTVFIGAGTIIKENVRICSNVLIGAGSVVTKSIIEPGVYYGLPATKKK